MGGRGRVGTRRREAGKIILYNVHIYTEWNNQVPGGCTRTYINKSCECTERKTDACRGPALDFPI